ncbi:putative dimethylaniline monooxygenase, partial [Aspergillus ellipticus CBS 707.79]
IKRVAVIGAGPAGAIATDALIKEQAFSTIRVFDRQTVPGGTWVLTPQNTGGIPSLSDLIHHTANKSIPIPSTFPCETPLTKETNSPEHRFSDTGSHAQLHSNLPPEIMCFTQEPIPAVLSEHTLAQYGPASPFRSREVMQDWVSSIFTRNKYDHLLELGTTVELAERQPEGWVLTLRKIAPGGGKNYWWEERFDAIVVATGHYYLPYIPDIPGLVEYEEKFPGTVKHSKHYRTVEDYRNKRVLVVGGSISAFDALHDNCPISKTPIISSLRKPSAIFGPAPFTHPDIDNRSEIASVDPSTGQVHFTDGSSVDKVDHILFATGYDFSFPFLPQLKSVNKRIPGLYQHFLKIDDPSLAFIGMVMGGFGIRIFEWQAVATARIFAGHTTLPSQEEMVKWETDRLAQCGDGAAFWALIPDFETHFEALRVLAGEPVRGTKGRVLPRYRAEWGERFWEFVGWRVGVWER